MSIKYLSIEEAAKRAGTEEFLQNVKGAVIPRLIQKGLLQGKKEKKRQIVADDDALAHMMQFGVESFVHNQQGYSFMAVRAPIQHVAATARPSASPEEVDFEPPQMKDGLEVQPAARIT